MKIGGRNTGRGAYTSVRRVEGDVEIIETNFSRTGNHWDIIVEGTGIIDIIDISNTGKHYCRRVKIENGKETETLLKPERGYWDICPICL
ncbi:hypothetical protein DRP07_02215 [Archaeoglobales archaeon]|nr:MAG: hypothetical protein DRP07_02215 [Archaeoglobales archaeon]